VRANSDAAVGENMLKREDTGCSLRTYAVNTFHAGARLTSGKYGKSLAGNGSMRREGRGTPQRLAGVIESIA